MFDFRMAYSGFAGLNSSFTRVIKCFARNLSYTSFYTVESSIGILINMENNVNYEILIIL